MRVWRRVRNDLSGSLSAHKVVLCTLEEKTGTMLDMFSCCVFSSI